MLLDEMSLRAQAEDQVWVTGFHSNRSTPTGEGSNVPRTRLSTAAEVPEPVLPSAAETLFTTKAP